MKRVTLGAVLRECKRRGIRFAFDPNAFIDKIQNMAWDQWQFARSLNREYSEGAGSRFDKENELRYSPESRKVRDLINDIYKSSAELEKAVKALKKFRK